MCCEGSALGTATTRRGPVFHVTIAEPPGYRFTHFSFDLARFLICGLESLGVPVSVGRGDVVPGKINVLVGAHTVATPDMVRAFAEHGIRYVVVQGEIVTDGQLNRDGRPERFASHYLPLLQNAEAVWEFSPANADALRALGVEPAVLELGHDPGVEEIRHRSKDIDVFFYGSVTPRRKAVLTQLAAAGIRVEIAFDDLPFYRNHKIARSKVLLTLRQADDMTHVPRVRIKYLACNRALVVGEGGREADTVADLYDCAEGDALVERIRYWIANDAAREARVAEVYERIVARPMREQLRAPLRALGVG